MRLSKFRMLWQSCCSVCICSFRTSSERSHSFVLQVQISNPRVTLAPRAVGKVYAGRRSEASKNQGAPLRRGGPQQQAWDGFCHLGLYLHVLIETVCFCWFISVCNSHGRRTDVSLRVRVMTKRQLHCLNAHASVGRRLASYIYCCGI